MSQTTTTARATMRSQGVSGQATVSFADTGDPTNVVAEKYRPTDGGFVL
ncbi:MAG: DUF6544 family protein, partial [Ktedonobacterales bacterium]